MKLTYTERNGIFYPDLALPKQTNHPIGKYGRMRLDYLQQHRRGTYTTLLTSCTLNQHLYDTEQEAKRQINLTLSRLVNCCTTALRTPMRPMTILPSSLARRWPSWWKALPS